MTSDAFQEGGRIPRQFTCDGGDQAPRLTWTDPPQGTSSFALIVDDPDAPSGTFTHWMLYDIPGPTRELTSGRHPGRTLENDFGRPGYGGPCPPRGHGPHRYFFTLYALDVQALTVSGTDRRSLDEALRPHTLGTARLMGRYER